MKIGIFTSLQDSWSSNRHIENSIKSCRELGIDYRVVDITSADWLGNVMEASDCDGFFCPSTCFSQERKTIQDERYYFVSQILKRPIYPDFLGLYIHENKRNMATWLEYMGLPHAKTKVFTDLKECNEYLDNCEYPIVVKANIGAQAAKVRIVESKGKAKRMAKRALNASSRTEIKPGLFYWKKTHHPIVRWTVDLHNVQKDYFLVQEFISDVKYEWRILKVGDSYFGHQKLFKGKFASGSGLVGWVDPPKELLMMVNDLCDKSGFLCMDVDIFEDKNGKYYINELQSFFGSYLDYQMSIDGKHGRYVYKNGDFEFEEGDWNVYGSVKLKIEHFVDILSAR